MKNNEDLKKVEAVGMERRGNGGLRKNKSNLQELAIE